MNLEIMLSTFLFYTQWKFSDTYIICNKNLMTEDYQCVIILVTSTAGKVCFCVLSNTKRKANVKWHLWFADVVWKYLQGFGIKSHKVYGNSPIKLLNIIIKDNEIKINVLPLLMFHVPSRYLNSLWRFNNIVFHSKNYHEGINHILVRIKDNPLIVLSQFKDKL